MKRSIVLVLILGLWAQLPTDAAGQTIEIAGVVGLSPVGENSCFAVEIPLPNGQPLLGLRWYHNDETSAFPKLVLIEGESGASPDLTNSGLILDEIVGESLAWGEVTLATPVTSGTGTAYAVFLLPAYEERSGEGTGGGPGLGYRHAPASRSSFISYDGLEWDKVHGSIDLAVEAVTGVAKGSQPRALSEIGDRLDLPKTEEDRPARPAFTRLHEPYPNPFNPRVAIAFDLAQAEDVTLRVYDVRGRRVRTLISGRKQAGAYTVTWTGDDDRGRFVASGVYYARLVAGSVRQEKTMTLVR